MAMQKFNMFIVVGVGKWNHGEVTLSHYMPTNDSSAGLSASEYGRRTIGEVELEVDVPEFDLVTLEVEALEKAVQKERADSQVRVNLLLDRLSKLKAIGHDAPINS